jgi:hypothetical protein
MVSLLASHTRTRDQLTHNRQNPPADRGEKITKTTITIHDIVKKPPVFQKNSQISTNIG